MKTFNIIFIILFVCSAALQYNDPDPYIWMPLYLYAAWLCFLAIKGKFSPLLYILGLGVYIPYALYLLFDTMGVLYWLNQRDAENIAQSMKATEPWIERTREFFGLLIMVVVLLMNFFWLRRRKNRNAANAVQVEK